jgi:hypothetical protein
VWANADEAVTLLKDAAPGEMVGLTATIKSKPRSARHKMAFSAAPTWNRIACGSVNVWMGEK